jgi:hypothetical protein
MKLIGPIDARPGQEVVNSLSPAFFGRHLKKTKASPEAGSVPHDTNEALAPGATVHERYRLSRAV